MSAEKDAEFAARIAAGSVLVDREVHEHADIVLLLEHDLPALPEVERAGALFDPLLRDRAEERGVQRALDVA